MHQIELRGPLSRIAHLWDAKFAGDYDSLHHAVAAQFPVTREPIKILDVGCGTRLELAHIFERVPNAQITAMDQAPRMLAALATKYAAQMGQITLLEASCVQWPADRVDFDYVVSVLCVHHFPPETKVRIYRNFRQALKPGGRCWWLSNSVRLRTWTSAHRLRKAKREVLRP